VKFHFFAFDIFAPFLSRRDLRLKALPIRRSLFSISSVPRGSAAGPEDLKMKKAPSLAPNTGTKKGASYKIK